MQHQAVFLSVSEYRLAELITDAVASALRDTASPPSPPSDQDHGRMYLTRKELLDELQIAPSTLAVWQRLGYITPRRIGRRVYFTRQDVEQILTSDNGIRRTK